jgi:hypothetical protein
MKLAALVLAIVHVLGAPARAQTPELAREFQAGVDAYRLGKLDQARTHLEKARKLDPRLAGPNRFLAAVAQAQGRWQDCIDAARAAIALNPRSGELIDTRKLHETCRRSAGRPAYTGELGDGAAIAVTTNAPGATVKIGGLVYGGTPLAPRTIPAGKLTIELAKAGWKPARVDVEALAGVITDVAIELETDPDAPAAEGLAPRPPVAATTGWLVVPPAAAAELAIDGARFPVVADGRYELAPGTHVIELARPGHDPWRRRVRITAGQRTALTPAFAETAPRVARERTGLYLVAGGGALGAFGFTAYLIGRRAADEAREIERVETSRPPGPIDESVEPLRTRAEFEDARSRARRWAILSTVSYAAGAAVLGTGAYLLFRGASPRTDAPPPWALAPIRGGALVIAERAW